MAKSYQDIIDTLPKPKTVEEQCMYALVCNMARVGYNEPYNNPFYRMEKYWLAFYKITAERATEAVELTKGCVDTQSILSKSITLDKLADEVVARLLANGTITTDMIKPNTVTKDKLADDVRSCLVESGGIDEGSLNDNIYNRLLGDKNVATENIADGAITKAKLASDVLALIT